MKVFSRFATVVVQERAFSRIGSVQLFYPAAKILWFASVSRNRTQPNPTVAVNRQTSLEIPGQAHTSYKSYLVHTRALIRTPASGRPAFVLYATRAADVLPPPEVS